jgi:uncharacterized protein YkwD
MVVTTRHPAIVLTLMLITAGSTLPAQEPSNGPLGRLVGRFRHHRAATAGPSYYPAATASAQAPDSVAAANCDCSGGDPYGFTAILNRLRAAAGLHPVACDPDLSSWASQNNAAQCRRGIGHHVNPCGVQNCGWNYANADAVARGWMNSPGHRQNMLSPSITRFGIAFGPGPYWTLNAR